MRVGSVVPRKKARIEIIPLIDIMFFLLASFMMASLALMRLQAIQMDLPTATVPSKSKPDVIDLVVKPDGDLYVGGKSYNIVDLQRFLSNRFRVNSKVQVYIRADPASRYGMFISALDVVRQAGIRNVSCAISVPPRSKDWRQAGA